MSLWHRIKVRLGLDDEWDDEYYEDEEYPADAAEVDDEYPTARRSHSSDSPYGSGAGMNAVRRVDRGPDYGRAGVGGYAQQPLRSVSGAGASVTSVSPQVKMHIVEPKSFSEVQSIADKFKEGTPIIMNMSVTKPDLAKRLIDFASGLTYGLDGGLSKISDKVFMLTPRNVEVSDADRRQLKATGLFTE